MKGGAENAKRAIVSLFAEREGKGLAVAVL